MFTLLNQELDAHNISKRDLAVLLDIECDILLKKFNREEEFTYDEAIAIYKRIGSTRSVEELFELAQQQNDGRRDEMSTRTGAKVVQSGIYKCTDCDNEITFVKGATIPPCRKCNGTEFTLIRATK